MAGPPAPLRNAADTFISEKNPRKNYGQTRKIFLADNSAADTCVGLIYFGMPSGIAGATVTTGKLRLYSGPRGWGGSVTVTIRRLASRFAVNHVNWNRRPTVLSGTKTLTKTGAGDGTMWEFDVTSFLQEVANGAGWYGFQISVTGSAKKWFYSNQGPEAYRPELEIAWSDSPDAPENLSPDNGLAVPVSKPTLQWDFNDPTGSNTMQSFTLRLFTDSTRAAANVLNTGSGDLEMVKTSTLPQLDLDDAAYAGLGAGGTLYWRVQVTSSNGLVSGWSEVAYFTYQPKGTGNITNPAAGSPAFVNEGTPPFSWTLTGQTQKSYEVLISTPEAPASYLWRTALTSTDNAVTPPQGVIKEIGKTYRLTVRLYDTVKRATVPDDTNYVEMVRDFVYQFSPTVTKVTNLTLALDQYKPQATLEWDDGTAPDEVVIVRDGVNILEIVPSELLVSGTHYRYVDATPEPRAQHTWSVARKVNGVTSSGNPSVSGTPKAIAPILSQTDGSRNVFFLNPNVAADKAESSDIHYLLGNAPPILITQSLRGYEGTVSGVLSDNTISGLTAAGQLADLNYFKKNPGVELKFTWINKVMKVVIRNVTDEPIAYPDGSVDYLVSFEFFQTDF